MARTERGEEAPNVDPQRIDEAVLALLFLGLHSGAVDEPRAWKGFDWDALDRLHDNGFISDPVGKAKSVVFTEAGLAEAERLFERLFAQQTGSGRTETGTKPTPGPHELDSTFVHLEDGGAARPVAVTDAFWSDLMAGRRADLECGRLVTLATFARDWDAWEMHPEGEELVCLLSGSLDFVLEEAGERRTVALRKAGSFVLVPRGAWHTAKVQEESTVLFVTPGRGTQHRPRGEAERRD